MLGCGRYKALNALALAILMLGCDNSASGPLSSMPSSPTANPAPANGLTFVWAMVIDNSGACIPGGTVEVVAGQGFGQRLAQAPCDAWSHDGGVVFRDLTPGRQMTMRASAPGYDSEEKIVVPRLGPQMAIVFEPLRIK